jgi:diacylglycerol kinase family enzyme
MTLGCSIAFAQLLGPFDVRTIGGYVFPAMIAASSGPSAALIINPYAGRLSDRERSEVVRVLRAHFDLQVSSTVDGHVATALARSAAEGGAGLIVAFGGDGHVNEVVNGVVGTEAAVAVVPGGTMNVFARSLGVPADPMAAARRLIHSTDTKVVHLGKMDDRYFTFSAGCGFDAEAAELVESHLSSKRRFGEAYFYWSALKVLAGTYRHRNPGMTLHGPFGEVPVSMAIACNTGPYAYLMNRPIRIAPEVHLEKGLDVFALRRMRIESLPSYAFRAVVNGDVSRHKDSFYASDIESFEITADAAFARHVDGEPLAPASHARFSLERDVLRVRV